MEPKHVAIIGAGTMGHGIAQIFAMAGVQVTLIDVNQSILLKSVILIQGSLGKLAAGGRIADKKEVLGRITTSTKLDDVASADLVIEAVPEKFEVKKAVLREADQLCKKGTIATNTSSLSVTKLAACTKAPARVIGLHFLNPPALMDVVEIVPGAKTSKPTITAATAIVMDLGKTPVVVKDVTGFVLNRLYIPVISDAIQLAQDGVATPDQIDLVMTKGAHWPMGPLALADLIGLDVVYDIMKVFSERYRGRYVIPKLLTQMIKKEELGKKSGKGFYKY